MSEPNDLESKPFPTYKVSARIEWPGGIVDVRKILSPEQVTAARLDVVQRELLLAVDEVLSDWRARAATQTPGETDGT